MKEIVETYYVLQDSVTKKYLDIDRSSGGYPYFTNDYKMAKKFINKQEINTFYNGGKWNGAYKTMFPKECNNLVERLVTVTLEKE